VLIEKPDLDSDLEWMLQSGQANDQLIIETLVNEFYALIFRFSLSCLGVNQEAREATLESLATALVESHRYSGKEGARLWLLSIAVKMCSRTIRKSLDRKYPSVGISQENIDEIDNGYEPQSHHSQSGWSVIDKLPLELRLPLLLQVICDLTVPEMAIVLGQPEKVVASHLQMAYQRVGSITSRLNPDQSITIDSGFEKDLASSLQANWPLPYPTSSELEQIKTEVQVKVERLRRSRRSRTRTMEISMVALIMTVVISVVGIANFLQSSQEGIPPPSQLSQHTQIPYQGNRDAIPTHLATINPTPTPTLIPAISLPPLDRDSTEEQVYEHIRRNTRTWHSLWADVFIYFYGPRGYIGPPVTSRQQVWIVGNKSGLVIYGPLEGKPESFTWERITANSPISNNGLRNVMFNQPISWLDFSTDTWMTPSPTLFRLLFSKEMMFEEPPALQIVRASAEFPGYTALVVDQLGNDGGRFSRLWIDVNSGLPLRERFYDWHDPQSVILDVVVNALVIDEEFPENILGNHLNHPLRENFAADPSGQVDNSIPRQREFLVDPLAWRVPSASLPAPPGFDPSHSYLSFEFVTQENSTGAESQRLRVFADDYLLADLPPEHPLVLEPFRAMCHRSPDGSMLAFGVYPELDERSAFHPLHWLRLSDISNVHTFHESSQPFFPAIIFSPDSRFLAMVTSDPQDDPQSPSLSQKLVIFDTVTETFREMEVLFETHAIEQENDLNQESEVISIEAVIYWSPDGDYILGYSPDVEADLLAIDVISGRATAGELIDYQFPNVRFSFPTLDWQGEFEFFWIYDLSFCVDPPGN
jgi:DNA-directed RNA polymerase specialized sigma24 family protein